MKTYHYKVWFIGVLLVLGMSEVNAVHGQVNSWSNSQSGTWAWETAANWTSGAPNGNQACFITNAASSPVFGVRTRIVTVGSGQAISNLTVAGAGGGQNATHNTLFINNDNSNFGGLLVEDGLAINSGSTLSITNSILYVNAGSFSVDGGVLLNNGTIETLYTYCDFFSCDNYYEAYTVIGNTGFGTFTMKSGNWQSGPVLVGSSLTTYGTLTISGGSTTMAGPFDPWVLDVLNGSVWLTGGELDTPGESYIGSGGAGTMTVSNGTWTSSEGDVFIGDSGGSGTLTIAGGTVNLSEVELGDSANSAGALWMNNGELNCDVMFLSFVGPDSSGQMTLSNGTVNARGLVVGYGDEGTLTVAGGSFNVYAEMDVAIDCTATGIVNITGGSLFVTNAAHNAVLDVESGTVTLSGGTLCVDKLILTNSCGHFVQTGGTLVVGGVTNVPGSFQITALGREGNNMRITWTDAGGHTDVVQVANGSAGNYTTNFSDLSPQIILPGFGNVTTNYLDNGGATNIPSRYYRVRLVP